MKKDSILTASSRGHNRLRKRADAGGEMKNRKDRKGKESIQEVYIIHQGIDRKALKTAALMHERKTSKYISMFNKMIKRVDLLDNMIPEEIKEMNRQKR